MASILRRVAKRLLRAAGYTATHLYNDPRETYVGLAAIGFRTVIDVGANSGQYARVAIDRFAGARLICVEPLPGPFRDLAAWGADHPDRVTCLNLALGDADAEIPFHLHVDHSYSSSFLATTTRKQELFPATTRQDSVLVPCRRLDDVLAGLDTPVEHPLLLKLDVQGFEDRVLRGAPATLARADACVLEVNIEQLYEGQARFVDLVNLLDAAGLAYLGNAEQVHARDGRPIYIDAAFVRRER